MVPDKIQAQFSKINRKAVLQVGAVVIVTIAAVFGIYKWYDATHLRLMATDPGNNEQNASMYTWVRFRFNKPVDPEVAKNFSISPQVDGQTVVKGKDVIFYPTTYFVKDKEFTAKLSSARTTDGKHKYGEVSVKFRTVFGDKAKLPKDRYVEEVYNTVDKGESHLPRFDGQEALLNDGVTASQVQALHDTLMKFKPDGKKFIIDVASITQDPQNTETGQFFVNFNIQIDDNNYKARLDYTELEVITLYLLDNSGKQVYDSSQ